jgi:hypothetical protein
MRSILRAAVTTAALTATCLGGLAAAPFAAQATLTGSRPVFPAAAVSTTLTMLQDVDRGIAAAHAHDATAQAQAFQDAAVEARTLATASPSSAATMNAVASDIAVRSTALATASHVSVTQAKAVASQAYKFAALNLRFFAVFQCDPAWHVYASPVQPATPYTICLDALGTVARVLAAQPGLTAAITDPVLCLVGVTFNSCAVDTDAILAGYKAIVTAFPADILDFGCEYDPTEPGVASDETVCELAEPSGPITDAQEIGGSLDTLLVSPVGVNTQNSDAGHCYGHDVNAWYQYNNNSVFAVGETTCDAKYWQYDAHLAVQRKVCGGWGCHYEDRGVTKNWSEHSFKMEYHRDIAGADCKAGKHRWRGYLRLNRTGRFPGQDTETVEYKTSGIEYTCRDTSILPPTDMEGLIAGPGSELDI